MRRNRICWLLVWILSIVGISLYGGAISYSFFALVTAIPMISLFYLLCVFLSFRIYQEIQSNSLVSNHMTTFYFTLQNETFFAFSGIRIIFFSSFSQISGLDETITYELQPHTGIKKQTKLVCRYRGEYEVGVKQVEIQDFFRLFRLTYRNKEALRVVVKPNLVHLESIKMDAAILQTARENHSNAYPDVLVRDYVPGDDYRQIHWKASAGAGELFVRRQVGEEQNGIGILFDTKRYDNNPKEYLPIENKILETTLALALYYVKKKIAVHTCYLSTKLEEQQVNNMQSFDTYYEMMAAVGFDEGREHETFFACAAKNQILLQSRAVIFVLHEWSDAAVWMAQFLNENNIAVFVYLITDDLSAVVKPEALSKTEIAVISTQAALEDVM